MVVLTFLPVLSSPIHTDEVEMSVFAFRKPLCQLTWPPAASWKVREPLNMPLPSLGIPHLLAPYWLHSLHRAASADSWVQAAVPALLGDGHWRGGAVLGNGSAPSHTQHS